MFARVRVVTGTPHEALLVPENALGTDRDRFFLYVLNEQNVVERRSVKVGDSDGNWREIKEGLKVQERFAIPAVNNDQLVGSKVMPVDADQTQGRPVVQ
jgi:multidrug efflux pump subunit AcrA (membrane-fusion protein)